MPGAIGRDEWRRKKKSRFNPFFLRFLPLSLFWRWWWWCPSIRNEREGDFIPHLFILSSRPIPRLPSISIPLNTFSSHSHLSLLSPSLSLSLPHITLHSFPLCSPLLLPNISVKCIAASPPPPMPQVGLA